jgi:trehalose/maltose hydrolase-like predicted phosphorylase
VTPTWANTGEYEQHISGDIAFAAQQYWLLTRNLTWLATVRVSLCLYHYLNQRMVVPSALSS